MHRYSEYSDTDVFIEFLCEEKKRSEVEIVGGDAGLWIGDIIDREPHDPRDAGDAIDDDPIIVGDREVELVRIFGDETDIGKAILESGFQAMRHIVLRQIRISEEGYFHTE